MSDSETSSDDDRFANGKTAVGVPISVHEAQAKGKDVWAGEENVGHELQRPESVIPIKKKTIKVDVPDDDDAIGPGRLSEGPGSALPGPPQSNPSADPNAIANSPSHTTVVTNNYYYGGPAPQKEPVRVVQPMQVQTRQQQIVEEKMSKGIPKKVLVVIGLVIGVCVVLGFFLAVLGMIKTRACNADFDIYYDSLELQECKDGWVTLTLVGWLLVVASSVLTCILCCLCQCQRKSIQTKSFRNL